MLVIFGWKVRWRNLGGGTFHCPVEGGPRAYDLLDGRRWFALFFVPVIPLKQLGRQVRCQGCRTAFPTTILATQGIEQAQR